MMYDVDEMPPFGKSLILAIQHVFAMFGATILVPILVNDAIAKAGVKGEALSIAVALVTAGIGTLIYIACTRAKSPVFLGSSFAFIAPIAAAYIAGAKKGGVSGGLSGAMTGVMVIGIIYIITSIIIRIVGKKWIDKILPPIVIGPMIMIIGLGLAGSAVGNIFDTSSAVKGIEWKGPLVALITFMTTALVMTKAKGFFKIIPFLVGIAVGYLTSCVFGLVNFEIIKAAAWFQVPTFHVPFVSYKPNLLIAITMAPIALVTMAEHIGDHKALSTIIGKDLLQEPGLDKTLLGDGLATLAAGALGGPANTTYGENTSVVGMTKNASVGVIGMAAVISIILGFLGKFNAIVQTIPKPVLGGVCLLLYGFIAINGLKVLIENKTDFSINKNIIIASAMLVLGLGGAAFSIATGKGISVEISGMSLAALAGILLNLFITDEEDEEEIIITNHEESKRIKEEAVSKIDELKKAIKDELTIELKDELLEEIKSELNKDKKNKRGE